MKYISFLLVAFLSFNSFAQTVTRVQGSEVMVTLEGSEDFVAGDRVHFLNQQLNTSGEGEVVKLSAGGKKALVKVLSGKVQTGMTLEKKEVRQKNRSSQDSGTASLKADGVSYASLSETDRQILRVEKCPQLAMWSGVCLGLTHWVLELDTQFKVDILRRAGFSQWESSLQSQFWPRVWGVVLGTH